MVASAADLPPELFENILSFFDTDEAVWPRISSAARKEAKQFLSSCSLTCLYWATKCRPRLFHVLTLRSTSDVYALRAFMATPHARLTPILVHIRIIFAEWKLVDPYWLHTLHVFLQSHNIPLKNNANNCSQTAQSIYLYTFLIGPLPTASDHDGQPQGVAIRDIATRGLPRMLPPFFSRCHLLMMENIHFHCFADCVRLLRVVHYVEPPRGGPRMRVRKLPPPPGVPSPMPPKSAVALHFFNVTVANADDNRASEFSGTAFFSLPERIDISFAGCPDATSLLCATVSQLSRQIERSSGGRVLSLAPMEWRIVRDIWRILIEGRSRSSIDLHQPEDTRILCERGVVSFITKHPPGELPESLRRAPRWGPVVEFESEMATARLQRGIVADEDMVPCHISKVAFTMWSSSSCSAAESMADLVLDNDWDAIVGALQRFPEPIPIFFRFLARDHCVEFFQNLPIDTQNILRTLNPTVELRHTTGRW